MTATPIPVLERRLKLLSVPHQIHFLRSLLATYPHARNKRDLQFLLQNAMQRQLKAEIRTDRRSEQTV